jgi:CxxC-x17-CxxC domain-containing protein
MNQKRNNNGKQDGDHRSFGEKRNNSNFGRNRNSNFRRNDFSSEKREMHKAVCSKCGKNCEVPFKPTEGKPVYCKDCFIKNRKF